MADHILKGERGSLGGPNRKSLKTFNLINHQDDLLSQFESNLQKTFEILNQQQRILQKDESYCSQQESFNINKRISTSSGEKERKFTVHSYTPDFKVDEDLERENVRLKMMLSEKEREYRALHEKFAQQSVRGESFAEQEREKMEGERNALKDTERKKVEELVEENERLRQEIVKVKTDSFGKYQQMQRNNEELLRSFEERSKVTMKNTIERYEAEIKKLKKELQEAKKATTGEAGGQEGGRAVGERRNSDKEKQEWTTRSGQWTLRSGPKTEQGSPKTAGFKATAEGKADFGARRDSSVEAGGKDRKAERSMRVKGEENGAGVDGWSFMGARNNQGSIEGIKGSNSYSKIGGSFRNLGGVSEENSAIGFGGLGVSSYSYSYNKYGGDYGKSGKLLEHSVDSGSRNGGLGYSYKSGLDGSHGVDGGIDNIGTGYGYRTEPKSREAPGGGYKSPGRHMMSYASSGKSYNGKGSVGTVGQGSASGYSSKYQSPPKVDYEKRYQELCTTHYSLSDKYADLQLKFERLQRQHETLRSCSTHESSREFKGTSSANFGMKAGTEGCISNSISCVGDTSVGKIKKNNSNKERTTNNLNMNNSITWFLDEDSGHRRYNTRVSDNRLDTANKFDTGGTEMSLLKPKMSNLLLEELKQEVSSFTDHLTTNPRTTTATMVTVLEERPRKVSRGERKKAVNGGGQTSVSTSRKTKDNKENMNANSQNLKKMLDGRKVGPGSGEKAKKFSGKSAKRDGVNNLSTAQSLGSSSCHGRREKEDRGVPVSPKKILMEEKPVNIKNRKKESGKVAIFTNVKKAAE